MAELGRTIAAAVKTGLEAQTFTLTPTVVHVPNPLADLEAVSSLTIFVSDETKDTTRNARQGHQTDAIIHLGVFKQAENTLTAQDPLADFVQEVEDYLSGDENTKPPRMGGGVYISHRSIKPEEVKGREWPGFTRLLRFTYRVFR